MSESDSGPHAAVDEQSKLAGELRELRELLRRVELDQLEASDWPRLKALLAAAIDEGEATGQEEVLIGFEPVQIRDPEVDAGDDE